MSAERLWAPWRMRYVQGERKDEGCIFCLAAESGDDGPGSCSTAASAVW
jgi:hypothetical protein